MKQEQDKHLLPGDAYIRYMEELPALGMGDDPDDEDEDEDGETSGDSAPFRIAICMTKEGSLRLLKAKFLQSDIAFRRVVGFKEFELGALERDSRTSKFDFLLISRLIDYPYSDRLLSNLRQSSNRRGPPNHFSKNPRDRSLRHGRTSQVAPSALHNDTRRSWNSPLCD